MATSRALSASATAGSRTPATCSWRSPTRARRARGCGRPRSPPPSPRRRRPDTALQIAFTSKGLRQLGLPDAVHRRVFATSSGPAWRKPSNAFTPPWRHRRQRSRGWEWGGSDAAVPDLVVMLFARKRRSCRLGARIAGRAWVRAFAVMSRLPTNDIGDIEPFGFADGVSQPKIDWTFELELDGRERLEFGNVLALGEVLLGYPNEYGLFTDRPLLDPAFDPAAESCRRPWILPTGAISAGTAATSCSASSPRTSAASGGSCRLSHPPIMASVSRKRWSVEDSGPASRWPPNLRT